MKNKLIKLLGGYTQKEVTNLDEEIQALHNLRASYLQTIKMIENDIKRTSN